MRRGSGDIEDDHASFGLLFLALQLRAGAIVIEWEL